MLRGSGSDVEALTDITGLRDPFLPRLTQAARFRQCFAAAALWSYNVIYTGCTCGQDSGFPCLLFASLSHYDSGL